MCIKIDNRMECYKCGYPYSEARWPDELGMRCDATQAEYDRAVAPHVNRWNGINSEPLHVVVSYKHDATLEVYGVFRDWNYARAWCVLQKEKSKWEKPFIILPLNIISETEQTRSSQEFEDSCD